ncbi:cysteine hydrolase family protein [Chitinolyticbacter albus]|uniref:cysteine hydrolase family protein n=1 Tax=Chitinolyticbacter albus TaxID=2961951 RepID=UPI0027E5716B|nr:isochorismatase family protein [Chitinolyticbacter albus]
MLTTTLANRLLEAKNHERLELTTTAVLLMDLQVDFLDSMRGRMPVGDVGAERVIAAARRILGGQVLPAAIPVAIVNEFKASQKIGNFFRRGAAVIGAPGGEIDPRITLPPGIPIFSKSAPSAFSNPQLQPLLQSHGVSRIVIVGVYAEGCVRATALAARALGYAVTTPLDAIASNAAWKLQFAKWAMRRRGVLTALELCEIEDAGHSASS